MLTLATTVTAVTALVESAKGAYTVAKWLSDFIANHLMTGDGSRPTNTTTTGGSEVVPLIDPGKVMQFVYQLGLSPVSDVDKLLANWPSPPGFTPGERAELTDMLKNLVRGARFHSTHGTKVSSYVAAEKLLEQLLEGAIPQLRVNQVVDGWELKKFLGMGGFGEVWLAENELHHSARVYKFFTREGAAGWLKNEATTLKAFWKQLAESSCDNVVQYEDVRCDGKPHPYLVLEYATLGTLEDWILTKPPERVARIPVHELMKGIARGASDAHKHGIHHRDLKPANILLTGKPGDVTPKVADFGLGSVEPSGGKPTATRSQTVLVGTQMYHPPEAGVRGMTRCFAQDDVFALGVIWFQVLTGQLTRPSYDFAEELALAGADSRSIKLIGKCLASPKNRYPSACELYDDMDREEPPPGPGEWDVPEGCFDVAGIAREYLERTHT